MRTEAPAGAAQILLLADRAEDITLIKSAADQHKINHVERCPAVLSFLRRQSEFSDCPRPDLIILDLNLSDRDHCETLQEIKEDADFKRIPVVVMARDDSPAAIRGAYSLHANAYVIKPAEPEEFARVIKATLTFWLDLARLPKH